MSEFELRVTPSETFNGPVCFYGLVVEREGLRVESDLRVMDLMELRGSCERPVVDVSGVESPVVVESRDGQSRLLVAGSGVSASMPLDVEQRLRLRDLCEQGLSVNRDLSVRTVGAQGRGAELRPVRKGRAR